MKCPIDGASLLMSERHSIEVDYCPECRGIWLDRGELDKILERVRHETDGAGAPPERVPERDTRYDERRYDGGGDRERYDEHDSRSRTSRDPRASDPRYRKKKSPFEFLGDLFEG